MNLTAALALCVVALVLGAGVPWLGMKLLVPSLREASARENFRGRPVFQGLGIVWLLWAGCAILGGGVSSAIAPGAAHSVLPMLMLAGPLALVAFGLGVVDDAYGSGASRGFKGHLAALRRGRLTTGGMKLLGISLASLIVALILSQIAPWGDGPGDGRALDATARVLLGLAAGAAIALTSNLVNLTDLRPGRALKTYSALAVAGVLSTAVLLAVHGGPVVESSSGAAAGPFSIAVDGVSLLIFVLGPVVAVWRYDLSEQGMLGDAGANPMGAVAGMLIVAGLPLWGLLGYLALVLALNLASERVSFTEVIAGNRVLSWLDGLGRVPETGEIARPE